MFPTSAWRGVRTTSYEHLLRWYPSQWRDRYGDEMTALLEDTYATASDVPLGRAAASSGRAGGAALGRRADRVGGQRATKRLRGGSLLVLVGWAFYLVAVAIFVKATDHWFTDTPAAGRWVATSGFNVVAVAAVVGCAWCSSPSWWPARLRRASARRRVAPGARPVSWRRLVCRRVGRSSAGGWPGPTA